MERTKKTLGHWMLELLVVGIAIDTVLAIGGAAHYLVTSDKWLAASPIQAFGFCIQGVFGIIIAFTILIAIIGLITKMKAR